MQGGEEDGREGGQAGGDDGGAGFDGAPDDPVDDCDGEVVVAGLVFALEFDHVVEAEGGGDDAAVCREERVVSMLRGK